MAASSESSYVPVMGTARWALAALLGAAACSGSNQPAAHGPKTPPPSAGIDAGATAATAPLDAGPGAPLTDAECDDFVDHVVAIAARKRADEVPAEQVNTDEEVRQVSEKLRTQMRALCKNITRELFACAMKAPDATALAACEAAHGEAPDPS